MRDWLGVFAAAARAAVAGLLVFLCVRDLPAARAHDEIDALPGFDFRAEADALIGEERYDEALLVLDAGLELAAPGERTTLEETRRRAQAEQGEVLRRARAAALGAWTGRGDSAEALGGALIADLFVFGDVRDLVIEGGRALRGEDADEVLVALSAAGIGLTAAPGADLGAALLKFARRVGAMSEAFARHLIRLAQRAVRQGRGDELAAVAADAGALARGTRPGAALAILRHVDDPAGLRWAARIAERPGGAFALWLGGRPALAWGMGAGPGAEKLLLRAARKGRAGMGYLAAHGDLLLRAHPLLGLFKALRKGHPQALAADALRRHAGAVLGLLGAWLAYELTRMAAGLRRRWVGG
ncbi:MAG: hypothetical protein HYV18_07265 [Gammaproteobacteria bacterium]|nr:hypothetical protein [Gammaproteobacteria bacterium]